MKEQWKEIPGFNGDYIISNIGRIKSLKRKPRLLRPCITQDSYELIQLSINGKQKGKYIHRLVAKNFVSGYREGLEVNHKDGNTLNNIYTNLEWLSHKENIRHAWDSGNSKNYGESCSKSKLKRIDIIHIRKLVRAKTQREVAEMYNISQPHVSDIVNGKTWLRSNFDNVK